MNTVSVTVDYGNGARKSFTRLPWRKGLTLLEALDAARAVPPGIAVAYGSSRNGSVIDLTLDGLPEADGSGAWSVWIDERQGPARLGTETSYRFDPGSRAANEVQPGQHVVFRLAPRPAAGP